MKEYYTQLSKYTFRPDSPILDVDTDNGAARWVSQQTGKSGRAYGRLPLDLHDRTRIYPIWAYDDLMVAEGL